MNLQTTMFRHEAREVVRKAVNASQDDVVIFAGSGCTGAIHKLIDALGIKYALNICLQVLLLYLTK